MPTTPTWLRPLVGAINAEQEAERSRAAAEDEYRRRWWQTTWALADVERAKWGEARDEYRRRTGHSGDYAKRRRTTGARLPERGLATPLPQPRFAQVAADALGSGASEADTAAMVGLLAYADEQGMSLREFSQQLTGRSWGGAESLTPAEEDAVVRRVARNRPAVLADIVEDDEGVQDEVDRRLRTRSDAADRLRSQRQRTSLDDRADELELESEVLAAHRHVRRAIELAGARRAGTFGDLLESVQALGVRVDGLAAILRGEGEVTDAGLADLLAGGPDA